jgi:hypothetical protein
MEELEGFKQHQIKQCLRLLCPAGVSWIQFGKAVIGWILTIIIVGLLAGIFTALGVFAPSLRASQTIAKLRTSVKDASSNQIGAVAKTCAVRLISDYFLLVEHCVTKVRL